MVEVPDRTPIIPSTGTGLKPSEQLQATEKVQVCDEVAIIFLQVVLPSTARGVPPSVRGHTPSTMQHSHRA